MLCWPVPANFNSSANRIITLSITSIAPLIIGAADFEFEERHISYRYNLACERPLFVSTHFITFTNPITNLSNETLHNLFHVITKFKFEFLVHTVNCSFLALSKLKATNK
jgi:hypothetical protein